MDKIFDLVRHVEDLVHGRRTYQRDRVKYTPL
jgi:hypothetical protein